MVKIIKKRSDLQSKDYTGGGEYWIDRAFS